MRLENIRNAADWQLDATFDDNYLESVFQGNEKLQNLIDGRKSIVTGRKGTGKTAYIVRLAQILKENRNAGAVSFDLQNFPIPTQEHLNLPDFFPFWSFELLRQVAKLGLKHRLIAADVRDGIKQAIEYNPVALLSGVEQIPISKGGGLTIPIIGGGLSGNYVNQLRKLNIDVAEKARIFKDMLIEKLSPGSLYIAVDGIDSNYYSVSLAHNNKTFHNYVGALIRAIIDLKASFHSQSHCNVYPIVTLRSDIYNNIQDANKNHWEGHRLELSWSEIELKQMIDARLAHTLGANQTSGTFEKLFANKQIHHKPIWRYVLYNSMQRPRDIIAFVQNCAKVTQNFPFKNQDIKKFPEAYSEYIKNEIVGECQVDLPEHEWLFKCLQQSREPELEYEALRQRLDLENADEVIEKAFAYNIVGIKRAREARYSFAYPNPTPVSADTLVVHPGLRPYLGLAS